MSQEAPIQAFRKLRLEQTTLCGMPQRPEDQNGFKFQNIGFCVGSKAVLRGYQNRLYI